MARTQKPKNAESTGFHVMLRVGNTTPFRRSRRNAKGDVIETHVFESMVPFAVSNQWVEVLRQDIGRALVIVNLIEKDGQSLPRVDHEATAEVVLDRDGPTKVPQESAVVQEVETDEDEN